MALRTRLPGQARPDRLQPRASLPRTSARPARRHRQSTGGRTWPSGPPPPRPDPFVALWCSPLLRAGNSRHRGRPPGPGATRGAALDGDRRRRLDRPSVQRRAGGRPRTVSRASSKGAPTSRSRAASRLLNRALRVAAALADVDEATLPALVVCHGVRDPHRALPARRHKVALAERVPNARTRPPRSGRGRTRRYGRWRGFAT